jgi:hypothetical protein
MHGLLLDFKNILDDWGSKPAYFVGLFAEL